MDLKQVLAARAPAKAAKVYKSKGIETAATKGKKGIKG